MLSLALVVTKLRAQNVGFKNSFANSYFLVLEIFISFATIFPLTILFGRDYPITAIFL